MSNNIDNSKPKHFHLPSLFHLSVCSVALIANGFVLVVIWKDPKKCLRTRSAMLITSLIFSDLFAAAINILHTLQDVLFSEESLPRLVRIAIIIGSYSTLMISFTTIFLISLEHLLVITHPIKFKILFTKKWILWIIASTWLSCAILLSGLHNLPTRNELFQSVTGCSVLLLIALPTIYARAFVCLKRQSKGIKAVSNSAGKSGKQKRISQQRNFLLTSAVLVLVYLMTAAPFTIHQYLKTSQDSEYNMRRDKDRLGKYLWTVLFLNLLLDPFLYCLRIPQYRKSCAALMCKSARS